MPTFAELLNSRDGSRHGVSGSYFPRTFRIIFSAAEITHGEFTTPYVAGVLEGQYPIGSSSPWNVYAVASDYEVIKREAPNIWTARIDYRVPDGSRPPTTGWLPSTRGTSIGMPTVDTVPDEPTSELPYGLTGDVRLPTNGFAAGFVKRIGNRVFLPDRNGPFRARIKFTKPVLDAEGEPIIDANGDPVVEVADKTVRLKATEMVEPILTTEEVPGLALNLVRVSSVWDPSINVTVAKFYKRTNSANFLGGLPGHVKLDDFAVDPIPANSFAEAVQTTVGGQSTTIQNRIRQPVSSPVVPFAPVAAYRLSLTFIESSEPLDIDEKIGKYSDPVTGGEAVIEHTEPSPTVFVERYLTNRRVDFRELFRLLV